MFRKKVFAIITGGMIMVGSCIASESLELSSVILENRIDVMKTAYNISQQHSSDEIKDVISRSLNNIDVRTDIPSGINSDYWKKSQKIYILSSSMASFNNLDITIFCSGLIDKIICDGTESTAVKDKTYRLAKYLLASQCSTWDEGAGNFELSGGYDKMTISDAIGKLSSAINGDYAKSQELLKKLKRINGFSSYITLSE